MNTQSQSRDVVVALVDAGLVEVERAGEADAVVAATLGRTAAPSPSGRAAEERAPVDAGSMRRRLAEIAGYVGGAFVVGAAVLFFANTWSDLSLGQRTGLLVVTALVLAAAGALLTVTAGGVRELRNPAEAVRRRLTSVLLTGAAGSTAFAVGLQLSDALDDQELAIMLAALSGLVVVLVGYVVAPTTVGQLGAVVASFTMIPSGLSLVDSDSEGGLAFGTLVLALGIAWLVAAERGLWHEVLSARVIGLALALIGAQIPIGDEAAWIGYVLTAAVGALAFVGYLVSRSWPYLAAGVVGLTLAVPEALSDWTNGSLGAAGALLATGVTLLVAALLGLRLRQEVKEGHA